MSESQQNTQYNFWHLRKLNKRGLVNTTLLDRWRKVFGTDPISSSRWCWVISPAFIISFFFGALVGSAILFIELSKGRWPVLGSGLLVLCLLPPTSFIMFSKRWSKLIRPAIDFMVYYQRFVRALGKDNYPYLITGLSESSLQANADKALIVKADHILAAERHIENEFRSRNFQAVAIACQIWMKAKQEFEDTHELFQLLGFAEAGRQKYFDQALPLAHSTPSLRHK